VKVIYTDYGFNVIYNGHSIVFCDDRMYVNGVVENDFHVGRLSFAISGRGLVVRGDEVAGEAVPSAYRRWAYWRLCNDGEVMPYRDAVKYPSVEVFYVRSR